MAKFSERVKQAADNAERMVAAIKRLPGGGSASGATGAGAPALVTFVTNIRVGPGAPGNAGLGSRTGLTG